MTQSLSPKSLDLYVQKYVYVPFHFLPGDNNVEINKKSNPYSTTPNSNHVKMILGKALDSNNPYQMGIALHTFADTWSHQNFTGLREDWNSVYPWYNVFKSLVPNIGHAEVGHSPDIISEEWTDYRFKDKKIKNRERAFEATKEIFNALRKKSRKVPEWKDVEGDFEKIINTKNYDGRIEKISDFLKTNGHGEIPDYSKNSWIDAALDKNEEEVVMKPGFTQTHWYNFHQAAKIHLAHVMGLIKKL